MQERHARLEGANPLLPCPGRTAGEYFELMATRAAATGPEVLQYDAQLQVGARALDTALRSF